jgi:Fe2+ or Zn2+ uptake regulation protein
MNEIDLEKAQREEIRWRILRTLDAGRPVAVAENIIYRTLYDISLPVTPYSLRRELDYLEDKGLIKILNRNVPTWCAELTGAGVDVVEYTVEAPPGISRPQKWW